MPTSYQNGKIYQIVCNVTGEIYIGSTCQPTIEKRLAKHITSFKSYKKGVGGYTTSFRILENNNYNIYLIENFPCETKYFLNKREGEVIREMKINELVSRDVVNKLIPGRTQKEYRDVNKDILKTKKRNTM